MWYSYAPPFRKEIPPTATAQQRSETQHYKILARNIARRIKQVMNELFKYTQFCAVPGNSSLHAASQVRNVITHAENTGTPLCMLTLDIQNAFDRI